MFLFSINLALSQLTSEESYAWECTKRGDCAVEYSPNYNFLNSFPSSKVGLVNTTRFKEIWENQDHRNLLVTFVPLGATTPFSIGDLQRLAPLCGLVVPLAVELSRPLKFDGREQPSNLTSTLFMTRYHAVRLHPFPSVIAGTSLEELQYNVRLLLADSVKKVDRVGRIEASDELLFQKSQPKSRLGSETFRILLALGYPSWRSPSGTRNFSQKSPMRSDVPVNSSNGTAPERQDAARWPSERLIVTQLSRWVFIATLMCLLGMLTVHLACTHRQAELFG